MPNCPTARSISFHSFVSKSYSRGYVHLLLASRLSLANFLFDYLQLSNKSL
ncbi:hypothetical protein GTCCBUS3UF5_5620 [Geobacillus thermoleovorans CCB_US3_UF5]|uniref:Uncharacterized protein n=1 Tax=Geobacillus thermoleovorans CCB_US3_UF5 TaxID=1111068 RepID=A0ABM5ME96_GEOTH|nr:hypothetical protein GTCCBUS3UF5_5620 [Geobacillus thermoleovorans CCB_US3_UF5]